MRQVAATLEKAAYSFLLDQKVVATLENVAAPSRAAFPAEQTYRRRPRSRLPATIM